jgi:catecholate siderophore receptor
VGTKWDLFHDRVALTAAIFRTEKTNTRVLTASNTYENAGKTRVDGFELGVTGKLTEQWQVFAGYSYLDSTILDPGIAGSRTGVATGLPNASKGKELPNTAKNNVTLWTTYAVTPKLTVGGGAFYMDDVWGDTANTVYVPSYTRFDAMASYKLNKTVDFQVNVQNLTDKLYYDKAYAAHFANQAAGRTVLLSTNFHF